MSSLRERNKLRAREDLLAAAARLFRERGFAETTVSDIAEEVGVSRRTFFRYFPSKLDLALDFEDREMRPYVARMAERAADGSPLAALVETLFELVSDWELPEHRATMEELFESQLLIATNPDLQAAYLRREALRNDELVRLLAPHAGVEPGAAIQLRLWVSFVNTCIHVSLDLLRTAYEAGEPVRVAAVFHDVFEASGLLRDASPLSFGAGVATPDTGTDGSGGREA